MKYPTIIFSAALPLLLLACGKPDQPTPPVKEEVPAVKPTPTPEKPAEKPTDKPAPKPAPKETAKAPEKIDPKPTSDLVKIKVELPKPLFIGTPKNLRVRNLDKKEPRRPVFKAPAGVVLLSRDKAVSSSDEEPIIGELEMVTDGDKDGTDGSYVELGFGSQWVQIDLEKEAELHAIVIWHYHQEGRVYHDVVVQVGNDPDFTTGVKTLLNNDDDSSSGLGVGKDLSYVETYKGKLVLAKGIKARYLRLYSNGNTSNDQTHYVEVEVFGKPGK